MLPKNSSNPLTAFRILVSMAFLFGSSKLIYSAPEKDAEFLLFDVFDVEQIWSKITDFRDIDRSTIEAIIAEGSRLSI